MKNRVITISREFAAADAPSEKKWQNSWASPAMMQRSFRKW